MIFFLVLRAILVLLAALAAWRLSQVFGGGITLVIWAAGWAIACVVGALLLWTSTAEKVTWKNRLAGFLIPWGGRLNQGRLWPLPVISWLVWMAIGVATVWLMPGHQAVSEAGPEDGVSSANGLVQALLLAAWIVDGSALIYVLGTLSQAGSASSSNRNTLLKIVAVVLTIIGGSMILYGLGFTRLALALAGAPPLFIGGWFGLFLGIVLMFGHKVRWN